MADLNFIFDPNKVADNRIDAVAAENSFRDGMAQRNLLPPSDLVTDGKLHRCDTNDGHRGKGDGAYIYHPDGLPAGGFQNHRDGLGWENWCFKAERQQTATEKADAKRRIEDARREREAEDDLRRSEAKGRSASIWDAATECAIHPYLTKKNVAAHGARISRGKLVIPARDVEGQLQTLQFIDADGGKRYLKDGQVKGSFFIIATPSGTLCIAEGFATGATIHEVTGIAVAVAFDSGNLMPVALALRAKFPDIKLVLCADDDAETDGNPGTTKATEAARAVNGLLAVPVFCDGRPSGVSDFNDLCTLSGAEAVKAAIERAALPEAKAEANDWPSLVQLDHPILPRLRGDELPSWAGDYAAAIAAATETPPELALTLVLATCATAVARRFKVRVHHNYFEPTNLWLAIALEPGNRKSAVQRAATAALVEWERKQAEGMQDEIKKATSDYKTAETRANRLRTDSAKEKDGLKSTNLARQAADIEAAMPVIPHPPQLWTSDVTPERLGTILADNDERMAWLSSEGGIFEMLGGRYSKGIPNLDLVLKAHIGDSERVDRGSRPPVFLFSPLLSIGLSPQPDVLRGLAAMPGFRGRGLLGRFLYLLPPSPLGYRTGKPLTISEDIEDVFAKNITTILNMPSAMDSEGNTTTHLLKLSAAAYDNWQAYRQCIEEAMRPGGDFENAKDWAGKAPGSAIRIAGILHVITHIAPSESPIDPETMERALTLMAVFGKHSLAALEMMGADAQISAAEKVWRWLDTGHRAQVSLRDIHQALKGSFPHAAEVRKATDVLVERGYVAIADTSPLRSGRRQSPMVIVRPNIVAGWR